MTQGLKAYAPSAEQASLVLAILPQTRYPIPRISQVVVLAF